MGAVMVFARRADAGRSGANSLPPWRAARKTRLRLPASAIVLGYIALTAAFAVILGVALATFTTTNTNTQTLAPALSGAGTDIVTINAATTGTSGNTGGAGQITGDEGQIIGGEGMSPRLIHNLGARSAITSAVGRF